MSPTTPVPRRRVRVVPVHPRFLGVYTANTFGSNFDTLLAVYTAEFEPGERRVARRGRQNDDANTGTASSVTFNVSAGTTYYIAIDGFNDGTGPAEGTFQLNLTPSANGPTITDFTPATATSARVSSSPARASPAQSP